MNSAVIIEAKRTAIGKAGGQFKNLQPEALAAPLIEEIVKDYPQLHDQIDQVILGNVVGPGGNIGRLTALTAGLPLHVPGSTVDLQCGAGLEAIRMAANSIYSGAGEVYLAGGVESASLAPWKIAKPQNMYGLEAPNIFTRARFSPDTIGDPNMGVAAENVAKHYHISREEQDEFAFNSHQKAIKAMADGRFEREIVPLITKERNVEKVIDQDECPRENTNLEKLSKLPSVFIEDGTVTAGNACPMNDGASMILMMSEEKAEQLSLKPKMKYIDGVVTGVDPNLLGIGPVPAVTKLLARQQLSIHDIDYFEINEAFASQVVASIKELHIPFEKVNIYGGAIALGHPYGASGAILVTRLMHVLEDRKARFGVVSLGIGGGLGIAALFERLE
ncbi:thiolase family protein [Anaerobacillus sp. MEB173]|uniref:thiolase family protein n=1 Tax=Anaerobacillus sp. MEB173 TaxID=3383345 RepID=UPI003F9042DB